MVKRVLGVTLALSVVLAGCTSEEKEPTVLPPVPSAPPSAVPLSPPPEAAAETAEGASAFARYYMAVISQAFQTTDADQLQALSDPGCGGCRNFIQAVEGARDAREVTRGGDVNVLFVAAPPVSKGEVIVDLRYERSAATLLNAAGAVVGQLPPDKPLDAQMRLMRRPRSWVVMGFRAAPVAP